MTTSLLDAPSASLLGSRSPRIRSVPKFSQSAGEDVADLAALAGLVLDPWQRDVLVGSLGERPDGSWASRQVGVVVGRQNGKNAILEARELGGLFLLGEQTLIHTAHQFKTAHEAFLRIRGLIDRSDEFTARVKRIVSSTQGETIELKSGARLIFVARGVNGSGRGFSADLIVLDEAYRLPGDAMAALLPTLSARPNPQMWFTSSAGFVDSDVLRSLRRRGIDGSPRLSYFEWSAPEGSDPADPAAWAMANPGLGVRVNTEALLEELDSLPVADFARERLGVWESTATGGDLDLTAWFGCVDSSTQIVGPVTFAVDAEGDRGRVAIAAAGFRSDGLMHAELVRLIDGNVAESPVRMASRELVRMCREHGGDVVLYPGSSAGAMKADLLAGGVNVREMTARDAQQACGRFYDLVMDQGVRVLPNDDLEAAVGRARKRLMGDAWVWDWKSGGISPLVALTWAAWGASQRGAPVDVTRSVW